MKACSREPQTTEEKENGEPFIGNHTDCNAELYTSKHESSDKIDVAWICQLKQNKNYMNTLGSAGYLIENSPVGNKKELIDVKACSIETQVQLQDVCDNEPQDFSLTRMHIMQSCYKRARAGMGEQKF